MKRWMPVCALMLALLLSCLAESAGRELSGYYGRDIAEAAAELGGLLYASEEEFPDNYTNDTLALRGSGTVTVISLKPGTEDSLCGVTCGMTKEAAAALMDGCPMLWEYDEEIAWLIRADAEDELKNEILVAFFDEEGKVNGIWYRRSGV